MFSLFGKYRKQTDPTAGTPAGGSTLPDPDDPNVLQASPSNSNNNHNTPPPLPKRSWTEAFRATCLEEHTLHVTIAHVQRKFDVEDLPKASQAVLWDAVEAREKALMECFQPELPKEQSEKAGISPSAVSGSSVASYVLRGATTTANTLVRGVAYAAGGFYTPGYESYASTYYDDEETEEESSKPSKPFDPVLAVDSVLLNTDLATECLHFLHHTILRHGKEDGGILPLPGGHASAAGVLQEWVGGVLTKESGQVQSRARRLVERMAQGDLACLLQTLVACGAVQVIRRPAPKPDLLLFGDASRQDVKITLYDLEESQRAIEKRVETLTSQKAECTRQALAFKKANNIKRAKYHLQLSKKLDDQIQVAEGVKSNLLQQQAALESAAHTADLLKIAQEAKETLQKLNRESENADEIMSDLQDEMDTTQEVDQALANMAAMPGVHNDDDLIAELEALTLDDFSGGTGSTPVVNESNNSNVPSATVVPPVVAKGDGTTSTVQEESGTANAKPALETAS